MSEDRADSGVGPRTGPGLDAPSHPALSARTGRAPEARPLLATDADRAAYFERAYLKKVVELRELQEAHARTMQRAIDLEEENEVLADALVQAEERNRELETGLGWIADNTTEAEIHHSAAGLLAVSPEKNP